MTIPLTFEAFELDKSSYTSPFLVTWHKVAEYPVSTWEDWDRIKELWTGLGRTWGLKE